MSAIWHENGGRTWRISSLRKPAGMGGNSRGTLCGEVESSLVGCIVPAGHKKKTDGRKPIWFRRSCPRRCKPTPPDSCTKTWLRPAQRMRPRIFPSFEGAGCPRRVADGRRQRRPAPICRASQRIGGMRVTVPSRIPHVRVVMLTLANLASWPLCGSSTSLRNVGPPYAPAHDVACLP